MWGRLRVQARPGLAEGLERTHSAPWTPGELGSSAEKPREMQGFPSPSQRVDAIMGALLPSSKGP